ncbi:MAG: 5'-3' exonuclease [Thermocrispum sp.]
MSAPIALLDAAGLYFRAFYALPDSMRAADGTPVNAVRGFTDTVARIISERKPSRLVVCLDADWRPQFRVDLLPSYKAHRVAEEPDPALVAAGVPQATEEVPDTLSPQVPIIIDLMHAFGLCVAAAEGFEADDVIGTLTARETTSPVEVVTGDRDLFQLVRDEPTPTHVIYVGNGWAKASVLGPQEIAEKYGVPPERAGEGYLDMSVLRGDASDGLPGVAGIGEKTAAKLITRYGSLHGLLQAAKDNHPELPKRARAQIFEAADYLAVAPTVVRVAPDAPVVASGPDAIPAAPADPQRIAELAEKWNLGQSVERLLKALKAHSGDA